MLNKHLSLLRSPINSNPLDSIDLAYDGEQIYSGRFTNWKNSLSIIKYVPRFVPNHGYFVAKCDINDMLAAYYDNPVRIEEYQKLFEELGLENITVCCGYNGIEGRAAKPRKNDGKIYLSSI